MKPNKAYYRVNRCNYTDAADMETMTFATKAEAVKWAKRCKFAWVRKISNKEGVFGAPQVVYEIYNGKKV